jgi:hypothetical protein
MTARLQMWKLVLTVTAFLFFPISGIVLISVFFESEKFSLSMEKMIGISGITALAGGFVHLLLGLPLCISIYMSTQFMANYISSDDHAVSPVFVF